MPRKPASKGRKPTAKTRAASKSKSTSTSTKKKPMVSKGDVYEIDRRRSTINRQTKSFKSAVARKKKRKTSGGKR